MLSQTTYTYLKHISYNFYCFTHIYLYACWKTNYVMHTLAFKREFHAIIHSFKKRPQYSFRKILVHTSQGISCHMFTYIHTIERCFPCYLYLHKYLHTIEKYLPRYLGAKYPSWGSPNSSKNSHKQILIFMFFYFQNQNLGS